MFEIFHNTDYVTHKETSRLRGIFGPFPASAATQACNTVNQLVSWLPQDVLESLVETDMEVDETDDIEFGSTIKFNFSFIEIDEDDWLESDSEGEVDATGDFDMRYIEDTISQRGKESSDDDMRAARLGSSWLKTQVEIHFQDDTSMALSVLDMCNTIFDILTSPRPDLELQDEV